MTCYLYYIKYHRSVGYCTDGFWKQLRPALACSKLTHEGLAPNYIQISAAIHHFSFKSTFERWN